MLSIILKNKLKALTALSILCITACSHGTANRRSPNAGNADNENVISNSTISHVLTVAQQQYADMLKNNTNLTKYPRSTKNGRLVTNGIDDWTGGFWPGSLWYLYDLTKNKNWETDAVRWTESLEKNQYNNTHHDIGFMMYCSYGNAYRHIPSAAYKQILIQSAKTLISRYDPKVKSIKSWNSKKSWNGQMWNYPVIIDNMMNLELLFFASKATGDPVYKNIAIQHAETTLKNHIRPDYSTYHVVNYDPETGKVLNRQTNQGFSDNSQWARGQAWAIYGFTVVYRETGNKKYLNTAQKLADFYIHHPNMPADKVPYWDFNAGQPGYTPDWKYDASRFKVMPRDASAAAVTASALLEMAKYLKNGKPYYNFAVQSLNSLSSPEYLAAPGTNSNFLLKHSTGSIPHGVEIDVPLVYADYYYLEALARYRHLI